MCGGHPDQESAARLSGACRYPGEFRTYFGVGSHDAGRTRTSPHQSAGAGHRILLRQGYSSGVTGLPVFLRKRRGRSHGGLRDAAALCRHSQNVGRQGGSTDRNSCGGRPAIFRGQYGSHRGNSSPIGCFAGRWRHHGFRGCVQCLVAADAKKFTPYPMLERECLRMPSTGEARRLPRFPAIQVSHLWFGLPEQPVPVSCCTKVAGFFSMVMSNQLSALVEIRRAMSSSTTRKHRAVIVGFSTSGAVSCLLTRARMER